MDAREDLKQNIYFTRPNREIPQIPLALLALVPRVLSYNASLYEPSSGYRDKRYKKKPGASAKNGPENGRLLKYSNKLVVPAVCADEK